MIVLGLILLLIGWLAGIGVLTTIGIIVLVVGLILMVLGTMDRAVGPRRYYY
jgi:membrane-bound ClpP family serine protease